MDYEQRHPAFEDTEEIWEDVAEPYTSPERISPSATGSLRSSDSSRQRRRTGTKTVFVADTPHRVRASKPAKQKQKKGPTIDRERVSDALSAGAQHSLNYTVDVVGRAIRYLRKPLSFLLFLWMFGFLLSHISRSLRAAFSPLCILPVISRTALCTPVNTATPPPLKWADFPELMKVQSSTFERLLDESTSGSGLSLEVRKAGIVTTDLTVLVRGSRLKSNDILGDLLAKFSKDAKRVARGLTKLHSKVGGAVDEVMAVNAYAMRTIQEAQSNAPSPYSLKALIPFGRGPPTQEIVIGAFTDAMDTMSRAIERLILEAEVSIARLDELEEDLKAIHEVVFREDASTTYEKNELLAQLWTRLGGNKRALRAYDDRLELLQDLGHYREGARGHVLQAMQTLYSMSDDMEDLRERVAGPELGDGRIPLDVHIVSIQKGLERLKEGQVRARKREGEAVKRILGADAE
ncbi:hypothetical protein BV22DRAFT_1031279 [Leucogyrophana mollusca]|uniref:Uncharacterized protein n=1 Tax=Leucogyrophana mollusca TaxID=85980 RepID=A0ACB8BSR5_9AGAM|nr:hypothetical protein BV22DRAFT_1031279 [Leucogyrophana mollusca]